MIYEWVKMTTLKACLKMRFVLKYKQYNSVNRGNDVIYMTILRKNAQYDKVDGEV